LRIKELESNPIFPEHDDDDDDDDNDDDELSDHGNGKDKLFYK
jgi:hypothetical protein